MKTEGITVDVLAIASHPDDIELTCGGTIAKLVRTGHSVAIAELTEGELGTRGSREIRAEEARKAAEILGVVERRNLRMPDGNIEVNDANMKKLISLIREFRPRFLLIPPPNERHPDHVHTHVLCREAWFYAGLTKIKTTVGGKAQESYRPFMYFCYMQKFEFNPTFIVDITGYHDVRMNAIRAHASQFHDPSRNEPETLLSRPNFMNIVETRAQYYGQMIGVEFGEPFLSPVPIGVDTLFALKVAGG